MRVKRLGLVLAAAALAWAAPPAPEQFFGHKMGADRTMPEWSKVVEYFRQLGAGSDRVQFLEYGRSTEGRPMVAGILSAPETLRRLEHYRQIQMRLSDPRRTSEAEAAQLAAEGKTIVMITCSVHATEIASTQTAVEFAWRLATSNDAAVKRILGNTIVILAPSINPDGVDIVGAWYRKTLGTPYEGTSPPELYQKYVGHDNNRDWYFFTQAETRAIVTKLQNAWHPQIVYDVHQMGPTSARIFVPPYLDPVDPNVDPLIIQEANMIGTTMAADLTASGRQGVAVNAMYDFWTPARHYQSYHGGIRILSESASARLASPIHLNFDQLSTQALGYSPRERTWNFIDPWPGGDWRLRDIVDDQLVAMESLCTLAAQRREAFLRGFYAINKRAAARETPFAFVVPARQSDPGAAKKLLETLVFGDVEIERASAPFEAGGRQYDAGSYVIRMQQPFSSFAKTLLERQKYPDLRMYPGGPPKRPYDVTAQTLPLLLGVAVDTLNDKFQAQLAAAREFRFEPASVLPTGALAASDSESWRKVNEAWKAGTAVWRDPKSGDFYMGARKPAAAVALKAPRIGLYKSFVPAMDEGWTRWILEQFGWAYTSLGNARIRAGRLRESFDVIVFPDQSVMSISDGYRRGSMPEEYNGGLGEEGAAALKQFLEGGGRVVFLNNSVEYAASRLGLRFKNELRGVASRDFYCPGSLLNVEAEPGSTLTLGLPREFTIWMEGSPVPELEEGAGRVVLRYPASGVLASGWLLGEKLIAGRPALVEMPVGQGKAVLFGMRPQYRGQSWLTLKLFFNGLVE
jgi:hypothetical protein